VRSRGQHGDGDTKEALVVAARQLFADFGTDPRTSVDLRLTQTELARLVGRSRQQVNRIIVALEREGAIERRGARIVAVHPALLGAPPS
jgi:CRP-like cAMP-binding protein